MGLRKKISIVLRTTEDGKVLDSFSAKAFLDSDATKGCRERSNILEDTTQSNVKDNLSVIEDFLAREISLVDIAISKEQKIVVGGCEIIGKLIGFQTNANETLTAGSEEASSGENTLQNIIITGA